MRRAPTLAEKSAWELLRNRRCLGLKFRRQHIVAGYIVDFYCAALRVAIEIDGPVHEEEHQKVHDRERTWALRRAGIEVIRIRNDELTSSLLADVLFRFVSQAADARSPLHIMERGTGGEADARRGSLPHRAIGRRIRSEIQYQAQLVQRSAAPGGITATA